MSKILQYSRLCLFNLSSCFKYLPVLYVMFCEMFCNIVSSYTREMVSNTLTVTPAGVGSTIPTAGFILFFLTSTLGQFCYKMTGFWTVKVISRFGITQYQYTLSLNVCFNSAPIFYIKERLNNNNCTMYLYFILFILTQLL